MHELMSQREMQTTSASLLRNLKGAGQSAAWARFVRIYSPLVYEWACRMALQHQDALDLVQDVFVLLVQKMPQFSYDGEKGFRNWLWIVTRNKYLERKRRHSLPTEDGLPLEHLAEQERGDDGEADFRCHLLERVLPGMRDLFQPTTWRAFWEHVVEGRPAPEVAANLGLTVWGVYKAKARVLSRLHGELADLNVG
jgi:RNA polymerase sigma-70 factor (ECF subfamily)